MITRHFVYIAILVAGLLGMSACAEELHILTTEVPPFVVVEDGKPTGFCVDVTEEIERRIGEKHPIEFFPWARAYKTALSQPHSLLLCPKRTEEREPLFKWVGPMVRSDTDLYVKSNAAVHVNSLQDAMALTEILIPRESYSYQYLQDRGFKNLRPVNDVPGTLRMLLAGRAPAMVFDVPQLDAFLKQENISRSEIKSVFRLLSIPCELGFSRDTPDLTIERWQKALDAMKKDGSYGRLVDKWFPVH